MPLAAPRSFGKHRLAVWPPFNLLGQLFNQEQSTQQLEALVRDTVALAAGQVVPEGALTSTEAEVARQMQIYNACRYCEGFCVVFRAMTRQLEFGKADIHYLAKLCHNCGACLPARLPVRAGLHPLL